MFFGKSFFVLLFIIKIRLNLIEKNVVFNKEIYNNNIYNKSIITAASFLKVCRAVGAILSIKDKAVYFIHNTVLRNNSKAL